MMVAVAGAQTTAEDAAKAADAQAQVAAQQADVQAQAAKVQADVQVQVAVQRADVEAKAATMQAVKTSANVQVQMHMQKMQMQKMQVDLARMAPMQAKLQMQMAPMMAKMEMSMAPLQAEMMARSAVMRAHMMARGLVMQDGMVSIGDPQVKDELFAGTEKFATGASDVTDVNLGPDMLGMVGGKHGGAAAHKLNFMVVRTYEYPRTGMYNVADVDAYRQKLRTGNWNCFIHTRDSKSGESTDICNRPLPNGEGNEMVIMTVEPKELTFIHMSGKGSLADLGKLGSMGGYGGDIPTPPEPPAPPAAPHP
jgi:hypothetical protein